MNVVLFGDSNTYGYNPIGERYDNRYSKILDKYFNNKINIYEEGLVGRTTIYHDSRPNCKALDDITNILSKYGKIDLLVIMLGTNDYKIKNARSLDDVKKGMKLLLDEVNTLKSVKKLLLISPISLSNNINVMDSEFDYESYLLSIESADVYKSLAIQNNALFLDAKEIANPGLDGEHLDEKGHLALANKISNIIENLYLNN